MLFTDASRSRAFGLYDLPLLTDAAFLRGLGAVFFFFVANFSFYLVMTLFMQRGVRIPSLDAGARAAGSASGMYGTFAQIEMRPEWPQWARCSSRSNSCISARRFSRLTRAVCGVNHDLRRIPDVDAPRHCTKLRQ
ncbi:hypothetical protein QWJ07_33735 [Frankia sp. RB7]|nr:hypothetical protein [Frankia sp. RB7]